MKVFGLAGWSGAGKTTLMVGLLAVLAKRGFAASTVKHAHHGFDIDRPGKDSFRHREAGAAQVMITSGRRWALMTEMAEGREDPLDSLIARMDPVDLVLVEGFKAHPHEKIEVFRPSLGQPRMDSGEFRIVAVASDVELPGLVLPRLDLNDFDAVADFILCRVGLPVSRR